MKPNISDIEWACCVKYGLTRDQLRGDSRAGRYAHPRQVAMYLARTLTGVSFPQIGLRYNRDHSTAMHAMKRVTARMADPEYAATIAEIVAAIPCPEARRASDRAWVDRLKDGIVSWIKPPPPPPIPEPVAGPISEPEIIYADPLARRLASGVR